MSYYIIKVENLGKKYKISHKRDRSRHAMLREVISNKASGPLKWLAVQRAKSQGRSVSTVGEPFVFQANGSVLSVDHASRQPFRRLQAASGPSHVDSPNPQFEVCSRLALDECPTPSAQSRFEEFWALHAVNFEVKQGEVVGIIGRNGAGKSTILKILSRITKPSEGQVHIRGRVASLLEVGTGFHPELTGRENIFLNGAMLGMSRIEVRSKFDEIVAFAEIDKFLDTPVKRYSSGMYVRLAFAVSAHLEPEILIVDEVLAVGDAEYQKKCLGRMSEVARGGRTVLFVSHNMAAIGRLCHRCIMLEGGKMIADLDSVAAIRKYVEMGVRSDIAQVTLTNHADRSGDDTARVVEARLKDQHGKLTNCFSMGGSIIVEYRVEYKNDSSRFSHSIEITNSEGIPIYHLWDIDSRSDGLPPTRYRLVRAKINNVELFPDRYFVTLWIGDTQGNRADRVADCLSFTIEQSVVHVRPLHKSKGLLYKRADWSYEEL